MSGLASVLPPQESWTVVDTNARESERNHEAPSGRRYKLSAHEPRPVPEADARTFLRDASFIVRNGEGVVQNALSESAMADSRTARDLEPGECIARYDELLKDALLARCAVRPGGAEFTSSSTRDEIIEFLLAAPVRQDAAPGASGRIDSGEGLRPDDPLLKAGKTMDELLAGG